MLLLTHTPTPLHGQTPKGPTLTREEAMKELIRDKLERISHSVPSPAPVDSTPGGGNIRRPTPAGGAGSSNHKRAPPPPPPASSPPLEAYTRLAGDAGSTPRRKFQGDAGVGVEAGNDASGQGPWNPEKYGAGVAASGEEAAGGVTPVDYPLDMATAAARAGHTPGGRGTAQSSGGERPWRRFQVGNGG